MSKYTTQLRFICEQQAGFSESVGYTDVSDVISAAMPKIFDFNYPIHDEAHRNDLQTKILKHYYTREIGMETYGLWKLRLDAKLNEIMPYYNEMYASLDYLKDPMDDVDYKRVIDGTEEVVRDEDTRSTQQGTSTSSGTRFDANSDTPQGALQNVRDEVYLSSAGKVTTDTQDSNNVTGTFDTDETRNRNSNTVESVKGKMHAHTKAKMVMEYRKAIVNVDMMVVNELEELFMQIF